MLQSLGGTLFNLNFFPQKEVQLYLIITDFINLYHIMLIRIGKYYAVEDMLTTEPTEKFGSRTLKQHYTRISVEGQDYDPYTTMLAAKKPNKNK